MNKQGKALPTWLIVVIVGVAAYLLLTSGILTPKAPVTPPTGGTGNAGGSEWNPAATYATVDKYNSSNITGTVYAQIDGLPATGVLPANVNPDTEYKYWISADNYLIRPLVQKGTTGNNAFVNREAYCPSTISLTAYDVTGKAAVAVASHNVSGVANGVQNVEFDYQPVYGRSNVPFGGVFVIEMNNTITSVQCTGTGVVSAGTGNFHLTYAVSNLSAKYQPFLLADGWDNGAGGAQKQIFCTFNNGASSAQYTQYIATIIPANYYVANDGNFYLDTEKFMNNGISTRTATNTSTFTGYFGA